MNKDKMQIDWDAIYSTIREVESATSYDQLVFRQAEVLAQLYQARALNEIAQSLYELVRDGIGIKRDE